ncbi:hypothetical protein BKE30_09945 [Alkanindiges hydrocarboniclasticus]|uniref:Uncharacterized protein n=2 Tax=Alkanindiges hydrocarboniclasticus TaxID=1907941 RepID=A0A1S8CUY2_9GAMM|nr:hypothetical protein BKE30_09945 [Alkanindiges hydrocarboniclasticus]
MEFKDKPMEAFLYQGIIKVNELNLTQMLGSTDEKEVTNTLLALVLYGENDWQYDLYEFS